MGDLAALIKANGQPHFGVFERPVGDINYRDYDLRNAMDKPRGKLARHFAFNQFQFLSLCCDELIIGVAIVDLKWVSNAFVYCYAPDSGEYEEFSFVQPLGLKTAIHTQPNNGEAHFCSGKNSVKIVAGPGQRHLTVSLASGLQVDAIIDEEQGYQPLSICTRAGYAGWVYTQKTTARPVSGSVRWQGRDYDLAAMSALAGVDWSAGYMRRETFWNSVRDGVSGVGPIEGIELDDLPVRIAGQARAFDEGAVVPRRDRRHVPRVVALALAAGEEALSDADLDPAGLDLEARRDFGVVIGTGGAALAFADIAKIEHKGAMLILRVGLFAGSYFALWGVFALIAALAQLGLRGSAMFSHDGATAGPLAAGVLLLIAGGYQFTKLKEACLSKCRQPMAFLMAEWRPGMAGAARIGARHGVYCLGCCWALMGLMFVFGAMNLWWMAAIAVYCAAEKIAPRAEVWGKYAGAAMIAGGVWMIAVQI